MGRRDVRAGFRSKAFRSAVFGGILAGLATMGCGKRSAEDPVSGMPAPVPATGPTEPGGSTPLPPQPTAHEPFDPPPLARLERENTWIDRPVRDGLVLLREEQAKEKPLATVAEALA
ncbi:MAG: hypothetical protein ACKOTB_01435, partial [Planctomycetia bacterium]